MAKGHNQGIMNDKRSQFSVMNDIVNVKKGHNTALLTNQTAYLFTIQMIPITFLMPQADCYALGSTKNLWFQIRTTNPYF